MPEDRRSILTPPLRCHEPIGGRLDRRCGELAVYMVLSHSEAEPLFFCHAHGAPAMMPIAGELRIRLVTLRVDVLFAGMPGGGQPAHREAFERMERAVQAAGGLLNLHDTRSELVRCNVQPVIQQERRGRGVGR